MRALAPLLGGAPATAALALAIFGSHQEGTPGFIGPGVFIADVNLVLECLLALLGFATYCFWYAA